MLNAPNSSSTIEVLPPRRFTLGDSLILIAALGLSMAMTRVLISRYNSGYGGILLDLLGGDTTRSPSDHVLMGLVSDLRFLAPPWLFVGSVSLMILRLLHPRPRLADVMWEPGAVASFVVVAIFLVGLALSGLALLTSHGIGRGQNPLSHVSRMLLCGQRSGSAVAPVWLTRIFVDRWRPQRDWIDRLGRAVGVAWIVEFLMAWWMDLVYC